VLQAWFKDKDGNVSPECFAAIVFDEVHRAGGTLTATPTKAALSLNWSGFSASVSGIAAYTLVFATNSIPASCSAGTLLYRGPATSFAHVSLNSSVTYCLSPPCDGRRR
jgi:hypothetical protein